MARKQKKHRDHKSQTPVVNGEQPRVVDRDWWLAAVAIAGMFLTAYLSYSAWTKNELAYCAAGSGCDARVAASADARRITTGRRPRQSEGSGVVSRISILYFRYRVGVVL